MAEVPKSALPEIEVGRPAMPRGPFEPRPVSSFKGDVPANVATGGWVPGPIAKHGISAAVACFSAVGTYLAAGNPTVKGALSACFVAVGGYFSTLFGISSAGSRKL